MTTEKTVFRSAGEKQKITPFLWFDNQAEEAVDYYLSIFKNSEILNIVHGPQGTVVTIEFELNGQKFIALNGGPQFKFTEAISFVVTCETQEEIDEYWNKLTMGGIEQPCGWLKDKFGLSWQIIPPILGKLFQGPDAERSKRVWEAMMKMKKIHIHTLVQAHEQD